MKIFFYFIILIISIFQLSEVFPAGNSQALFEQGTEAFKSGNYGSSELLLRKVIDSGDTEFKDRAWYYLALSIFNQKRYPSAVFEFNRFLSSCTTLDLCSMARYWIAESYYLQNDYIRAIQEFNRYIAQSKNNDYIDQAYDRIGRIYFLQRRYDEAIIEWTKSLGKYGDAAKNNQKRLNIGEAYFLNENYDEAINFLLPVINSNADVKTITLARLITGRAYQIKGKNTIALKIFSGMEENLLTEKPYNEVQYYRALSYIAIGNLNFAALHLKTFLSTGKDSRWIYFAKYELSKIYLKENNAKEATILLEDIRKSNSEALLKSRASMELSKIYFDTNIEESIKYLLEASQIDSPEEKKEALLLLGRAYTKFNKFKEAESILNQLVNNYSFDKNIDLFHFLLATVYLEQGDYEKTIKSFDKIKEVNPFSKYINESYYYLAVAHRKNNAEEAINLLNKYINLQKTEKKYEAYVNLFELYIQKRDYKNTEKTISILIEYYGKEIGIEEILYKYQNVLSENKKPNKYILNLIVNRYSKSEAAGKVLLKWGDEAFIKKNYQESEYFYRQYLTVVWRNSAASVFLYRIISLERLGRHKEIISILESKDLIPPMDDYTSKQISLWRARSFFNLREYKKAYDSYYNWRFTDLPEEDLLNMVKCSVKVDDIITAKKAADVIQIDKNILAEALYEISLYLIAKNNFESANDFLIRILNECPDSAYTENARLEISDINIKEEKFEDAIQSLNEIKNDKLQVRKNALLIISYFRSGKEKEALSLTKKYFNELIRSPYEEIVIKENILYYYKVKDIKEFNFYSQYLLKYPGNNLLINYLYGKLYFENYNYKTAYYYFYKLADLESEYRDEAIYYLGLISLVNNKDVNLALKYFKKISGDNNSGNKYAMQGKIDLSILAIETGNIALSKKVLLELSNNSENRLLQIQAENLIEYYGYSDNIDKKEKK